MARRKSKTRRRRKFTGVNLLNIAEGYSYAALLTDMAFDQNPIEFVFSQTGGASSLKVTLRELIDSAMGGTGGVYGPTATSLGVSQNAFAITQRNIMQNWQETAIKSVIMGVVWRLGRKFTTTPRRKANKLLKDVGLGEILKV